MSQSSKRPPLSAEERQQIRFIGWVLLFVLGAVLLAAMLVSIVSPILPQPVLENAAPIATVEP